MQREASAAGAAVTEWKYDGQRGWLTNKVYADGKGPTYTYTSAGRLGTRTWARGITTTYGYTTAGDLTTTVYSDTTPAVTNTFDRRGRTIQTVGTLSTASQIFDNAGNLLSEAFTAGALSGLTLTNQFDSLLRRTNVTLNSQLTTLSTVGYSYDSASRVSSVTFGTNSAVYTYLTNSSLVDNLAFKNGATTRMTTSNRYDNLNRRTSVNSVGTGSTPSVASFAYAYNSANQRTGITNADSSRWAYAYDTLGQVTSGKRYWSDGTNVAGQQFEYTFDDIGNRLTAASGGDQGGANLRSQNYSANNLNQYTQRTVPPYVDVQGSAHSNATVTVNLQSTYRKAEYFRAELSADNSGGPLWFAVTNVAVLTNGSGPDIVTTNEGNLYVAKGTETFLHDLDGNLTSDSLWTNIWNGENRLIATESRSDVPSAGRVKETWTHLPDGRWIERVVANWNGSAYTNAYTNRFVWDGQVLLAIVDHTNGLISSFVRGLDLSGSIQGAGGVGGVLAVSIATNGVHVAAFDGNGNVSALVSTTNGAVTATYEYSPFGETLRANGVVSKANPIRFSTQLADDVTGDNKWKYREERPAWGRWLSHDPTGERAALNLYLFTDNRPIWGTDQLGLKFQDGGYFTVFALTPGSEEFGYIFGLTFSQLIVNAKCVELRGCRCRVEFSSVVLRVHSQIALYAPPNELFETPPIPSKRFSHSLLSFAVRHEAVHRAHYQRWHDQNIPKMESEFRDTSKDYNSCRSCREKLKELTDLWQDKLDTLKQQEIQHQPRSEWEGILSHPLEYGPANEWWYGPPQLPFGRRFSDPLGRF